MRIVLDTNALVSAFLTSGSCADLFENCSRSHELVTSQHILDEFRRTLTDKLGFLAAEVEEATELILARSQVVKPVPLPFSSVADSSDVPVLGTALAAEADCIVTGDGDLLRLRRFRRVAIVAPADFNRFEDRVDKRTTRARKGRRPRRS